MSATSEALRRNAQSIVETALRRYDGPCAQAYADVMRAYIAAPVGGRDALFLEVAYRAVGIRPPNPSSCSDSPASSALSPSPDADPVADFVRSTLALIQSLHQQSRS